jgi:hypothetical protein
MSQFVTRRDKIITPDQSFMLCLREALEASWDKLTAYAEKVGNPASGQCYPTARVVQHYYPATEIIKGKVWTGEREEIHFWNGLPVGDEWYHIDFSWNQFPPGSVVREFVVLDRHELGDSDATLERCALLMKRVEAYLSNSNAADGKRGPFGYVAQSTGAASTCNAASSRGENPAVLRTLRILDGDKNREPEN